MNQVRTMSGRAALLLAMLAACAPAAHTQSALQSSDLSPRSNPWNPWVVFRSVTVKDSSGAESKITQTSTPMSLKARLGSHASAVLYGAFATTKLERGSVSNSMSGITDIRARMFVSTGSTVWSLGVSAPTGKHSLTDTEEQVANAAATDVLGFRVRRYGEGAAAEAGVTQALEVGRSGAIAIGGSFLYKAKFKPTMGSALEYQPGSAISASAGYDYRSAGTLLRLNASGRTFTKDKSDGASVFQQGAQIGLEERWVATLSRRVTHDLTLRQLIKQESKYYSAATAQVNSTAENGSSVGFVDRIELELASGLQLASVVDAFFYGKNASGFEKAHLLGFGGEVGYAASRNANVRGYARALTGSADPGGVKLSGTEFGASLKLAF